MRHLRRSGWRAGHRHHVRWKMSPVRSGPCVVYSPAAQKEFAGAVPPALTSALHAGSRQLVPGVWPHRGREFCRLSVAPATDINQKRRRSRCPLPMYCNVWIKYPVHALEDRDRASPGQATQRRAAQDNINIWKAAGSCHRSLSAPDFYPTTMRFYHEIIAAYHRDDNALFIPETGMQNNFGRYFFYALGHGAMGSRPLAWITRLDDLR